MNRKQPLIRKNKNFILFISGLSPSERSKVIPILNGGLVATLSEIFRNFLCGNLTQDKKFIKHLRNCRREIHLVSLKTTSISKKKNILKSRKGGAILSALLPIAASLVGSLFN